MKTPEEVAQEWLGCHVEMVEPGLGAAGTRFCGEHRYPWLHDVDMCPRQERAADLIRTRDAELAAKAWAEGYGTGVHDERMAAEYNAGTAEGVSPARINPYEKSEADRQ